MPATTAVVSGSPSALSPSILNEHLAELAKSDCSDSHTKNRRQNVLRIWDHAARLGLCDFAPRRMIRTVKVQDVLPEAWTYEEVCRLLHAAKGCSYICQSQLIPNYWECWVRLCWDGGLRPCDAHQITRSNIKDNVLWFVQPKTNKPKARYVSDETLAAIDATFPPLRGKILPKGSQTTWNRSARMLVALAGLEGDICRLRHSSGTDCEIEHPGSGHVHLGNTRRVFSEHYCDQRLLPPPKIRPKKLPA